jgi:hypothetical protein
MTHVRMGLLCVLAALALTTSGTAFAAGYPDTRAGVIADCSANDPLVGHYSEKVLAQALAHLPTDAAEYSTCVSAIRRAQIADAGKARGGSKSSQPVGQSSPVAQTSTATKHLLRKAEQAGSGPVRVGSDLVRPGTVTVHATSFLDSLPTPLLIVLGVLAAIVLFAAGRAARDVVRARRAL